MTDPLPACPHLPEIDRRWPAAALAGLVDPGEVFHLALRCAQSRWQDGLPAQSLLMLNRAFACDLADDAAALSPHPWPYVALAWILRHAPAGCFLGNPRRHFQHLATRMHDSPVKELRVARAWACWAIACRVRPDFPADARQLAKENITEPSVASILAHPVWQDRPRERMIWRDCLG
jgi:hypothetical protein